MEFLLCLLIASILTGVRPIVDAYHAAKGIEPPHLTKARLKAEKAAARRQAAPRPGDDKPTLRDVTRVYMGNVWQDAIDHIETSKAEKRQHRAAQRAAKAAGDPTPAGPTWKDGLKKLGRLLWEPVGEKKPDPDTEPATPAVEPEPTPETTELPEPTNNNAPTNETETTVNPDTAPPAVTVQPAAVTGPTGEAVNYETTVAELEALAAVQREHVDQAAAALKAIEDAKQAINNAQQSYQPAALAAQSINEHLSALNLDSETVAHTGTITDAMPPNVVDQMFEQLEEMEAAAKEQHANAEAALASTEAALATIVGKYGDAHATVAGELSGDSRFLASAAA